MRRIAFFANTLVAAAVGLGLLSIAPGPVAAAPPVADVPRSPLLRGKTLRSPMPGGYLGGWYGDTGLDIAGNRLDVFAIAAGTLDYSEWGHTLWTRGRDTPYSVRLALDEPIVWGEHRITHVYYTHLSRVEQDSWTFILREGDIRKVMGNYKNGELLPLK